MSHESAGRNERKDRIRPGPRRFLRDAQRKPPDSRNPFDLLRTLRLFRAVCGFRGRREELKGRQSFGRGFPLSRVFSVYGRFRGGSQLLRRLHIFGRPHGGELDSCDFPGREGRIPPALRLPVVRRPRRRFGLGPEAVLRLSRPVLRDGVLGSGIGKRRQEDVGQGDGGCRRRPEQDEGVLCEIPREEPFRKSERNR